MVAVGNDGAIVSSADRANWFPASSGVTTALRCVAYGNGVYVAAGTNGMTLRSTDGVAWTQRVLGNAETGWWTATFAQGKFVMAGSGGTIATSIDGQTWTQQTLPGFNGMVFGISEGWVAVCEGGKIFTSPDAGTWTLAYTDSSARNLAAVARGTIGFATAGDNGATSRSPIISSADAVTWTERNSGTVIDLNGVGFGNGLYMVVGDRGTSITSTDLAAWAYEPSAMPTLRSVIYSNGAFYACGAEGAIVRRTYADASNDFRFVSHPQSRIAVPGEDVSFVAETAGNSQPVAYQWFKGNFPIPGATTSTLAFRVLDSSDEGVFHVRATSGEVVIFSQRAELVVRAAPVVTITAPAPNAALPEGAPHRLAATVESQTTVTNVSFYNGPTLLGSVTAPPYEISPTLPPGDYSLRVTAQTDFGLSATAGPVPFTVQEALPEFTSAPLGQHVLVGRTITLSADVTGPGTLRYQWTRNNVPIEGVTTRVYTFTAATPEQSGEYRLIVSNDFGSVTSEPATVIIESAPPAFVNQFWRPDPRQAVDAYNGLAFGNGTLVAAGAAGMIAASSDGLNWREVSGASRETINRVRFVGDKFWAPGNFGSLLSSDDGHTWQSHVTGSPTHTMDVAVKDDVTVAVGLAGRISRREGDGPWQTSFMQVAGPTDHYWGIAAGNGLFVLVSNTEDGMAFPTSYFSTTGRQNSWTRSRIVGGSGSVRGIFFYQGLFVVLLTDGVYTSPDARAWTRRVTGDYLTGVITPTRMLIFAAASVAVTSNGIDWNVQNATPGFVIAAAYDGSAYYKVSGGTISGSLNGLSWNALSSPIINSIAPFPTVNFVNDRFYIARTRSTVHPASFGDGQWAPAALPPQEFSSFAYGKGRYIGTHADVFVSDNGTSFSPVPRGAFNIRHVVYEDGEFLGVRENGSYIARSSDGLTWRESSVFSQPMRAITKADGIVVTVGGNGQIYRAANSDTFVQVTSGVTTALEGATHGAGKFVAVGDRAILYSFDGQQWFPARFTFSKHLKLVTYADGLFFAVGLAGAAAYSWDGMTWEFVQLHTGRDLSGVDFGLGRWVVAGNNGVLLQTGPRPGAVGADLTLRFTETGASLHIAAPAGNVIRIEQSPDLSPNSWQTAGRVTTAETGAQWPISTDSQQFFYRAVTE